MLDILKKSELHVHIPGCYFPEDLFALAKDCYRDIDWNRFGFLDRYESISGLRLNPIDIFERALATGSLDELRSISIYPYKPQHLISASEAFPISRRILLSSCTSPVFPW